MQRGAGRDDLTPPVGTCIAGQPGPGRPTVGHPPARSGPLAIGFDFSCVHRLDQTIACWGDNQYGQLGDETKVTRRTPVAVKLSGTTAVDAGDSSACALRADTTVWCWGRNCRGDLGDGTTTSRSKPGPVADLTGVVAISVGTSHASAVKAAGTVWCWGPNESGELGDGTTVLRKVPVEVHGITSALAVTTGTYHTCALWPITRPCAGRQLLRPTWQRRRQQGSRRRHGFASRETSAGDTHTCAVLSDRTADCWGSNLNGELGNGSRGWGVRLAQPVVGLSGANIDLRWRVVHLRNPDRRQRGLLG